MNSIKSFFQLSLSQSSQKKLTQTSFSPFSLITGTYCRFFPFSFISKPVSFHLFFGYSSLCFFKFIFCLSLFSSTAILRIFSISINSDWVSSVGFTSLKIQCQSLLKGRITKSDSANLNSVWVFSVDSISVVFFCSVTRRNWNQNYKY